MARLSVYLLGNFQVRVDDQLITRKFRTDKERALLAYLAIEGNLPNSRETLAELFWPERPEGVARTNLRQALLGVRKAIEDMRAPQPVLLVSDETIHINRQASFWLDTAAYTTRFQSSFEHTHPALATCPTCAQQLQEAVDLYRQDFLDGLYVEDSPGFQEWVIFHREQYQRYLLDILDHLSEIYKTMGDLDAAQKYAWLHVKRAPLEERAYRRLMELLALSGRRSAAIEQYQTCVRMLQRELGVEPSPETIKLFEIIRSGQPLALNGEAEILHPAGLPRPMTEFFGREMELDALGRALKSPTSRLISVSGMPGVGKSRLVIEAAQRNLQLFSDGVYYFSLEGIHSEELFLPTLARAMGLTISLDNPRAQVFRRLNAMNSLLVIDQFDEMHTSTALLIELLQAAPQIKLLITSRQRLNLQAANLLQLEGLPYPADPVDSQAQQSPAVQLFYNRALRSRPGFQVDQTTLAHMVEICQMVHGLPLALELAADRLRELPVQTIAEYLQRGISVLSTSLQDMPARHRSLEKALLSAWQMLDQPLQHLLLQVSVFPASFTPEAAHAICSAAPTALAALADRSLLQGIFRGRYALKPLVRQFVQARLSRVRRRKSRATSPAL